AAAEPPAPVGAVAAADTIVIESPLYRYGISTAGGALVSAELLRFESFTREGPVQLVPADVASLVSYALSWPGTQDLDLSRLTFRAEPAAGIRLEPGSGPQTLTLTHTDDAGRTIEL